MHSGHSALRRGRVSIANHVYHVTTTTCARAPLFADFHAARIVATCLHSSVLMGTAETLCWTLMPDHLHWLVQIGEGQELSTLVRRLKGASAFQINRRFSRETIAVWAPSFHDHSMRRDENLVETARYIIANPVRAGLVDSPKDYPHWDAIWEGADLL
jgi:putative transposase